jgi:L-iditol 2-dehydrogenase
LEITMQVAVVTGPGSVELRAQPSPVMGRDDVRVRVAACGLCTMERRLYTGEKRIYPVAPGHEATGTVVEVGDGVAGLAGAPNVGDHVIMDLLTRCGSCRACRRGSSAVCRHPQGSRLADQTISMGAGLSDELVVPARSSWKVGPIDPAYAAMGEPLACVVHSLRRGGFLPGDHVGVVGGGYMGRLHLALCLASGAASVGVVDVSEDRRRDAAAAGSTWVAAPPDAPGPDHDLVFVTVGGPGALELGIDMCAEGGTVVVYGAFPKDLLASVGADHVHHGELSIVGSFSHEPRDWREAAGLLASRALEPSLEPLVTSRFSLDDVGKAFEIATTRPVYRVIVGTGVA